jgi:peptidoglycan/LPS O-acetylase OafA/YrhL
VNGTSAAQLALYGFFGLSGYLIARSAERKTWDDYLWARVLRIFPGLLVCLLFTSFVFGIVAWHKQYPNACGLSCYFGARDNPFGYFVKNALLANPFWTQFTIAGTPNTVIPHWNDSIWTLFYEFMCYLGILVAAQLGFLRRRVVVLVATGLLWLCIAAFTVTPNLWDPFVLHHNNPLENMARFAAIFFTGSLLYLYDEIVPDSGWIAWICVAGLCLGIVAPTNGRVPTFQSTPIDIFLPLIAYPILWLGIHLPFRGVGTKNDYSYGIYIYGFPVTQLLVIFNFRRFGLIPFELACLVATLPFAVFSWWLIERPSLRQKGRLALLQGRSLGPAVEPPSDP